MTPEQLKASILQYAIQGKLVEQRPEEGTGEKLYRQIQDEKKRLMKEGKIKKEKPFSQKPVFKDYPFDIPDTWIFVRFGELLITRDSERIPVSVSDRNKRAKVYDYYGASGVIDKIDDYLFDKELLLIGEDGANLLSRSTPIAFIAKGKYWVNNHAHVLDGCCSLNLDYICYYINAISLAPYVTGTAQPKMNQENMNAIWVPLPPLAEQKRIVAKIEELLPYIDRYAVAYEKLEQFNAKFPEDMKKSVLQYAIQGKLVEQRPEEGTGEELYRQIQEEKKRLIKEGKIKKEKLLPEIREEEIPFDIPESWKWVRLIDLCKSISDGDHQPPPQTSNGIPFLVISNVSSGTIDFANTRYVSEDYFEALPSERIAEKGDILFTVTGSYGIPVKVSCDQLFCFQRHIALLKLLIDWNYIFYALKSPVIKLQCDNIATGTAQKTVGIKMLRSIVLPLPPLAEQHRIVAKLEEILPLCERLK